MSWLIIGEENYTKDTKLNYINLEYLSGIDITESDNLVFFCDGRKIEFEAPNGYTLADSLEIAREIINLSLSRDKIAVHYIHTLIDAHNEKKSRKQ